MLAKFYLHYDDTQYELKDDDLYNWDEIRCSYKRGNYDGVVRSFTSQFVFVNRARKILLTLYLRDRYNAQASISVHTITDRWQWEEKFNCPLDFSTVSWEKFTLKINAVDNSMESLIKAYKSTKYEFTVGTDIIPDGKFRFDRMPMKESLTYGFTQGTSNDTNANINVCFKKESLPWVGNKGHEIAIPGTIDWKDDQTTDSTSYIFRVRKDTDVSLAYKLEWRIDSVEDDISFSVRIKRNGEFVPVSNTSDGNGGTLTVISKSDINYIGSFNDVNSLPNPGTIEENKVSKTCASIGGIIWEIVYRGEYVWERQNKTVGEYFTGSDEGTIALRLQADDFVVLSHHIINEDKQQVNVTFRVSDFVFSWKAKGKSEEIDVFTPRKVATHLLRKIADGKAKVDVDISLHDQRIPKTILMAAESLRGIEGAKFYSSFNEFCEWMATVFGYVYYIGSPSGPRYKSTKICGQIENSPWSYDDDHYSGPVDTANIVYIPAHAKFLYKNNNTLYTTWSGSEQYNDPTTGHPRTDTLFKILELSEDDLYFFEKYEGYDLYPILYDQAEDFSPDTYVVHFVHRSELLNANADIKRIPNCRDVKYNVDTSAIYSTVTAGYEKKEFDSINGRDEFNFNNTYSTGCDVSDKTLSIISKYRADCYGMEFAVQKRGEDTTDSSSDQDVFFVLCSRTGGVLVADYSAQIENSLSGSLLNGAFSPMACIRANAGLIGLQAEELTLKFASSTGNSEIVIDGEPMSADITLNTPLATSGWIEFTTDEVDDIANVNELVEIVDEEGMLYRGYLKEVDVKYTKTEAAKYKLIIKDIEP